MPQTNIQKLLDQLFFLDDASKVLIAGRFRRSSAGAQAVILGVLERGKKEQDKVFGDAILADPAFPWKLETFLHGIFNDIKRVCEKQEKDDAGAILDSPLA